MPQTLPRTLVLTADPARPCLGEAVLRRIRALLPQSADNDGRWLAKGEAWESGLSTLRDEDTLGLLDEARTAVAALPVDVNIVAGDAAVRRKRLLVADMESTIIEQEMLDELADYAGLRASISVITARAMRGELDFVAALTERVRLLAGLDAGILDEVFARVTLTPGAAVLTRTMKAHGACVALVSGGFTCFTARVAERLGLDSHHANMFDIAGGKLAGTVAQPVLGAEAKLATMERLAAEQRLPRDATLAVGDGAIDIPMLSGAGLGVAFRPKPKVAAHVAGLDNGAVIQHGDLTALLYLQGYAKDAFAT